MLSLSPRPLALLALLLCVPLLAGCATLRAERQYKNNVRKVLNQAKSLLGQSKIRAHGESYRADCSGFITACFAAAKVDLTNFGVGGSSGTEIIYKSQRKDRRVRQVKRPKAADLAFFHNTHDRNQNGLRDDRFTHIALVDKVDKDGTIHLIHHSSGKVRGDVMNLVHKRERRDPKSGKTWNVPLRRGRGRILTSQLFYRFARPLPKKKN